MQVLQADVESKSRQVPYFKTKKAEYERELQDIEVSDEQAMNA